MSEVFEHNPDDHDDPSAGPTWLMGGVGAILLVATVLSVTALYYNVKAVEVQDQVISRPILSVQQLRREQEQLLTAPARWVPREEVSGTVQALVIPIERAMEIVIAEQGQ